jgi:hypothetical protein
LRTREYLKNATEGCGRNNSGGGHTKYSLPGFRVFAYFEFYKFPTLLNYKVFANLEAS